MDGSFRLYKYQSGIILTYKDNFHSIGMSFDELVNREKLYDYLLETYQDHPEIDAADLNDDILLAPIGTQEVWASGVTYRRSKVARMEESEKNRGDYFYDKVYDAERPELFFKSTPSRVVGPGEVVHIRKDSTWNVPEPELTLFVSSKGTIEGYTCGNDMSSRSIEGENPLYLPQAKTYDRSAALGPCLLVPQSPIEGNTKIKMNIRRGGKTIFFDEALLSTMKRSLEELVTYLYTETSFNAGVFLMTGTGIVPDSNFTLATGDEITISIDAIGKLTNTVSQKA